MNKNKIGILLMILLVGSACNSKKTEDQTAKNDQDGTVEKRNVTGEPPEKIDLTGKTSATCTTSQSEAGDFLDSEYVFNFKDNVITGYSTTNKFKETDEASAKANEERYKAGIDQFAKDLSYEYKDGYAILKADLDIDKLTKLIPKEEFTAETFIAGINSTPGTTCEFK